MSIVAWTGGPPECAHIDRYIDDPSPSFFAKKNWELAHQGGSVQKYNPEYQACLAKHGPRPGPTAHELSQILVDPRGPRWMPFADPEAREKLIVAGVVVVSLLILAWR